jgi:hypothetical protein
MTTSVGVVICAHDAWPYLPEAVESVLAQTHPVDRLVIVDDASTDAGASYMAGLDDSRILVLRNAERRGPGAAAQIGIDACPCDLIARLDADDIAQTGRIAAQVRYLESHAEAVMVCTSALLIDETGAVTGEYAVPGGPGVLEWEIAFRNPVVQSSVMFRVEAFRAVGGYAALEVAEDYDLWSRLVRAGGHVGSIAQACVRLRKHGGQVSVARREEMFEAAVRVASANVEALTGSVPEPGSLRVLAGGEPRDSEDVLGAITLLGTVTRAYVHDRALARSARRRVAAAALVRTRELVWLGGLDGAGSGRALRACLAGVGLSGLSTLRGARSAVRMLAPARFGRAVSRSRLPGDS